MGQDPNERENMGGQPTPEQEAEAEGEARPGQAEDVGHRALKEAMRAAFLIMLCMMGLLVVVYLYQSYFTVAPNEVKIKLRFGKPVKAGESYVIESGGRGFCLPFEELITIPTDEQTLDLSREFLAGRRAQTEQEKKALEDAGRRVEDSGLNLKTDGYLITGDANILHMGMKVRYRASKDPEGALDYAFYFRQPAQKEGETTVQEGPKDLLTRYAIEGAVKTLGSWEVTDALSRHRQEPEGPPVSLEQQISDQITARIKEFKQRNGHSMGIEIAGVELTGPRVPGAVQASFERAQQARSQKGRLVEDANTEAIKMKKGAEAVANSTLNDARAYGRRVVEGAKADADMLRRLREAYADSPDVALILRERHYKRVIQEILQPAQDSFIIHRGNVGSKTQEIRLMIKPLPRQVKNLILERRKRLQEMQQSQ